MEKPWRISTFYYIQTTSYWEKKTIPHVPRNKDVIDSKVQMDALVLTLPIILINVLKRNEIFHTPHSVNSGCQVEFLVFLFQAF